MVIPAIDDGDPNRLILEHFGGINSGETTAENYDTWN